MTSIRHSYSIGYSDLLEAQIGHSGFVYRAVPAIGIFMIVVGLISAAMNSSLFSGLIMIAYGACAVLYQRVIVWLLFRKEFKERGPKEATLSDSGVEFVSTHGTSKVHWSRFERTKETKNLFLLYPQSNIFIIVPKRGLAAEDVRMLRDLLDRYLGEKSAAANKKWSPQSIILLVVGLAVLVLLAIIFSKR